MSRALGTAFLSHQVEQLEKSISDGIPGTSGRRSRRVPHSSQSGRNFPEKQHDSLGAFTSRRVSASPPKQRIDDKSFKGSPDKGRKHDQESRDADIIVLDASVLIHALGKLKIWSRDGREEIIIIPLEGGQYVPASLLELIPLQS